MKLWFLTFIVVTILGTLTKYMFNTRRNSKKMSLMNTIGPAFALGILFASLTSLGAFFLI
ncbi:hypothetical protein [Bacillus suaedaesalsae]|uniref:Uncharacterized protein n=1 Tax=Bacillus suaedaesalsae TaxID=2810349 RepID=A0ABS2DGL7_9BACI|nr:hypothetical protein [Bacillus suaedaesalsae]MBM6616693.1 hypothetical protein [Bacillus suaedaesalsae]